MHAELRAVIRIHDLGRKAAEASLASIRPDNLDAPSWLQLSETVENGDLVIEISVRDLSPMRLGSLRNTVDEILSVLYAMLRSIEETAKALKEPGAGASPQQGGARRDEP